MPIPASPRPALLAAALACALPHGAALAQARATPTDLDEVVVTATRTPATAEASLAAVEVIDRAEIERSAVRSLPGLLRGRAGIAMVDQGGLGKVATLFMRGTESDHVLVLVDGVRVGSATSGLVAWQDIPLEQVERIEIVRGPRSSLYGADAIGGVIQLFTRRGAASAGFRPRAMLAAGSHALRESALGFDARGARGGIALDAGHQSTDGIDACRGYFDPATFAGAGCFVQAPDPDRDGYRTSHVALRADFAPDAAWQFDGRAMRAQGRNAYDADPAWGLPDNSEVLQQVLGGSVRWRPVDALQLRLVAGRNTDASDNFLGQAYVDRFETRRDSASLQGDLALADDHALSLGLDWLRDSGGVDGAFAAFDVTRANRAAFAQYQGRLGAHELQLSARRDHNGQFGGHGTGGAAWGMDIAGGWRVTASHATAFKAPSFNELYYPFFGNPALRPESARSSEAALQRRGGAWSWRLSAYRNDIDDLIVYDTAIFAANNLERARIRGLELEADAQLDGWTLRGQLGALDARNLGGGAQHGKRLPRRPQRSARLDLERDLGRGWSVGATGVAEGPRWDDVANTLRVPGHATLDARASWRLAAGWRVQATVANAFDRRYETSAYYRQPGRAYLLAVRWQPQ